MSGTAQPISVEIRIKAREESLVFHPVGVSVDALIVEVQRQLNALMASYWKWLKFPVYAELGVEFHGKSMSRLIVARRMRELIDHAEIEIVKMLRQTAE